MRRSIETYLKDTLLLDKEQKLGVYSFDLEARGQRRHVDHATVEAVHKAAHMVFKQESACHSAIARRELREVERSMQGFESIQASLLDGGSLA
jgi:hypothetical protein